jgi:ERCC4-related helicase
MTDLKLTPYQYQIDDMNFLLDKQRAALLHEPGVGKTFGVLMALTYVLETEGGKALVVMPPVLLDTWYEKLYEYFDTDLKAVIYRGIKTQRNKIKLENYDIVFVSASLFHNDYNLFKESLKMFTVTVFDETKLIKTGEVKVSSKTKRMNLFGCYQAFALRVKYMFLMNGTPLTKNPVDVFHILH